MYVVYQNVINFPVETRLIASLLQPQHCICCNSTVAAYSYYHGYIKS